MEAQKTRLRDPHILRRFYQASEFNKESNWIEIKNDFKKLILAFRLYNGNYTGIRSIFINESFVYENDYFEPWRENPFLNSEFGNFRKTSYSYNLISKEIYSDDVNGINALFEKLINYESYPLKQINGALDHFFKAFEQNYPVYVFTELIMSFETLLHKEKAEIHMAIKILNQLIPHDNRKNLNKFFDNKNDGCYAIRNKLLHGDISLDYTEIRNKIPDLEEYVRLALLKIIELRINNKLNCNEENYFEKLKETLKSNVRT